MHVQLSRLINIFPFVYKIPIYRISVIYRYNSLYWPISTLWACTVAMHSICSYEVRHLSQYDGATKEFLTLTPPLGWSPANIAINDISLKTRLFELHFCRRIYWCIFNHFYAMRPGIRSNNAKYEPLRRSRSFKVIDFGTNRKLIYIRLPISD